MSASYHFQRDLSSVVLSEVILDSYNYNYVRFAITIPSGGAITLYGSTDKINWTVLSCTTSGGVELLVLDADGEYYLAVPYRWIKFETTTGGSADGLIIGHMKNLSISTPDAFDSREQFDSLGRLRVSNSTTQFNSKLIYADQTDFWDSRTEFGAGVTGTYNADNASYDIVSTQFTPAIFTRQTFRRFNYQSGASILIYMSGVLCLTNATSRGSRRIGYFDDNNGIFFSRDWTVTNITVRNSTSGSPVDTVIPQSSWNLDTLDGTNDPGNPSGIEFDPSKIQIFVFSFEWMGSGSCFFGMMFNGSMVWVHRYDTANLSNTVYLSTPNLPLRYQIETEIASNTMSMRQVCSSVDIEKTIYDPAGIVRSVSNSNYVTVGSKDPPVFLLAIRLKSGAESFNINLEKLSFLLGTANDIVKHSIVFNPTYSSALTWTSVATASPIEYAVGNGTITTTGGVYRTNDFVVSGTVASGSSLSTINVGGNLKLGTYINGTAQTLAVVCSSWTTTSDVACSLSWRED